MGGFCHPQHTYFPEQFTVTLTLTDTGESAVQTWELTSTLTPCTITYTYDALYRLTAADYSTGVAYAYQYDAVGNREVMTVTSDQQPVTSFYVYDAANRLTSIQLPDSSIQEYTWDNRGNLLADGTFTYTYSAAGRMVRAESITATLVTPMACASRQSFKGASSPPSAVWRDWPRRWE